MKVKTYIDAEIFLRNTYVELESNEAANSLMLGICGQLIHHPERVKAAPVSENGWGWKWSDTCGDNDSAPQPGWSKDGYTLQRWAQDKRWKLYDDGRFFDVRVDVLEENPVTLGECNSEAEETRQQLKSVLDRMHWFMGCTVIQNLVFLKASVCHEYSLTEWVKKWDFHRSTWKTGVILGA